MKRKQVKFELEPEDEEMYHELRMELLRLNMSMREVLAPLMPEILTALKKMNLPLKRPVMLSIKKGI